MLTCCWAICFSVCLIVCLVVRWLFTTNKPTNEKVLGVASASTPEVQTAPTPAAAHWRSKRPWTAVCSVVVVVVVVVIAVVVAFAVAVFVVVGDGGVVFVVANVKPVHSKCLLLL